MYVCMYVYTHIYIYIYIIGMLFQYPGLLMMSVIGFLAEKVDWTNGAFKIRDLNFKATPAHSSNLSSFCCLKTLLWDLLVPENTLTKTYRTSLGSSPVGNWNTQIREVTENEKNI
jgi:hypothetical protein